MKKTPAFIPFTASLCAGLLLAPGNAMLWGQQAPPPPLPPPGQAMAPDQLDGLVAPVALYPDPLLSQILVASTYPLELVEPGRWLQRNPIQLWPQHLIQIMLSPLNDVRVQIPCCNLVSALQQAGGITEWCHHMQQDYLRMKTALQPRSLLCDVPGSIRNTMGTRIL